MIVFVVYFLNLQPSLLFGSREPRIVGGNQEQQSFDGFMYRWRDAPLGLLDGLCGTDTVL